MTRIPLREFQSLEGDDFMAGSATNISVRMDRI